MSSKLYLHQFLSKTGLFNSKKAIIKVIKDGEIKIGDSVIKNPLYQFKLREKVTWKNRLLTQVNELMYIAINKPEGYLSSKLSNYDKKFNKNSIFDLIDLDKKLKATLFCVGRLDEGSSGLIIITNDGKLGSYLTTPGNVEKTYVAILEKKVTDNEIKRIEQGIVIDMEEDNTISKYKTMPCRVEKIADKELKIILKEGKKREVRRMIETLGNKVISLERVAIGTLALDELNLKKGEYKILKKEDLPF